VDPEEESDRRRRELEGALEEYRGRLQGLDDELVPLEAEAGSTEYPGRRRELEIEMDEVRARRALVELDIERIEAQLPPSEAA
jgi:hypothetical protein